MAMVVPNLHRCSWIEWRRVSYIRDGDTALVLYLSVPGLASKEGKIALPKMVEPKNWHLIYHQTSGYLCAHEGIYAMFLKPRAKVVPLIQELSDHFLESCISAPPSLTSAKEYEQFLARYGVGCEHSYIELQEAFYPVDVEFVRKMTSTPLPKDLDDLIVPSKADKGVLSLFSWRQHWKLAILGENCD